MENEKLLSLLQYDTPSITNVVATYPKNMKDCLGLYNPWECNWYTDQSLKCMYPEHGRRVGYVVTCVYGLPDSGFNRIGFKDLLMAIEASPKPVILAVKQNFPEKIKNKNGLLGGMMMTAFRSVGVVGVLSDGPSRDLDEIRPLEMQYMLTGTSPGHGNFELQAINVPVNICGMDVAPGEIVHMDENGAAKFPASYIDQVAERAASLQKTEESRQAKMRDTSNVDEIIKIITGIYD